MLARPPLTALLLALAVLLLPAALDAQSVSAEKLRLAQSLGAKNFGEATQAVDALIAIGSDDAIEALISVGLKGDFYGIEQYIGGRLLGLPEGKAFDRVCELASKEKNSKARVLLTLVLGSRDEKAASKAVLQNLYDPEPGVVLAAIEKLQERDSILTIGHLIQALEHQEKKNRSDGLIAFELRKTLLQLTGEDIVRAADWSNWWEPRKADFVRPERSDGTSEQRATSVYKDPARFFGIEVPADKVVFLLDVSGSMKVKDPAPEETADEADGGHGGTGVGEIEKKPPPDPEDIPESRQRLRRVQAELIGTIEKLPDNCQFNIITFNHTIGEFSPSLVRADAKNKRKAIEFVRDFKAEGETWTDHALRRAFETPELRTVFLLSDGAPKRDGERLDPQPILDWVREANRFSRVRIHTIGFEQAGKRMRQFLRAVSAQNHGEYQGLK